MTMKEKIIQEATEVLEGFGEVTLVFSNDEECIIGEAGNYLGDGEGYISETLGNVLYSSASSAILSTIEYLGKTMRTHLADCYA